MSFVPNSIPSEVPSGDDITLEPADLVTRDLLLTSFGPILTTDTINARWFIDNIGASATTGIRLTRLYLSDDQVADTDAGDDRIDLQAFDPLDPKETDFISATNVALPNGIQAGTYYLYAVAFDGSDEDDVDNNVSNFVTLNVLDIEDPGADTRSDFNGDGVDDLLFRKVDGANKGSLGYWDISDGSIDWTSIGSLAPLWTVVGTGDFSGDGTSDILVQHVGSGVMRYGDIDAGVSWPLLGTMPSTDEFIGVGDFNGDEVDDILFLDTAQNALYYWDNNFGGTALTIPINATLFSTNIEFFVGDFNGDGADSVLLSYPNGGLEYLDASGESVQRLSMAGVPNGWEIIGIGDFTGDTVDDVLMLNTNTGGIGFREHNTRTDFDWQSVGTLTGDWEVAGIGDFTGDGTEDILLENTATTAIGLWDIDNGMTMYDGIGASGAAWDLL